MAVTGPQNGRDDFMFPVYSSPLPLFRLLWAPALSNAGERATVAPYFRAAAEARLGHADKVWEWMEKSADQIR